MAPGVDQQKIAHAKDAVRHLDKLIKTKGLFGAGHSNVDRARAELAEKVISFLGSYGDLALQLDGHKILCDEVILVDNEEQKDDFGFRLFQDGIVELRILPGIDGSELDALLDILMANFTAGRFAHDDAVTLLWRSRPPHIRFAVASDSDDAMGDPQGGSEGTELYRRIRLSLADRWADGSGSAIEAPFIADQERVRGVLAEVGRDEGAAGSTAMAEELDQGEAALVEKYVEVALRSMASSPDEEHRARALAILKQLLIGLVGGKEIERATRLLKRLGSMVEAAAGAGGVPPQVARLAMGHVLDRDILRLLLGTLSPAMPGDVIPPARVEEVLRFLAIVPASVLEQAIPHLESVLEEVIRKRIADLMVQRGVASASDALEKQVRERLLAALDDPDRRVRRASIDRLARMTGRKVAEGLEAAIRSKEFLGRDKDEKRRICEALGAVRGADAVPFFRDLFRTSNRLKREGIDELRACGAHMLGALGDRESRAEIEKGAGARLSSSFFRWTCGQALARLDELAGSGGPAPGEERRG